MCYVQGITPVRKVGVAIGTGTRRIAKHDICQNKFSVWGMIESIPILNLV